MQREAGSGLVGGCLDALTRLDVLVQFIRLKRLEIDADSPSFSGGLEPEGVQPAPRVMQCYSADVFVAQRAKHRRLRELQGGQVIWGWGERGTSVAQALAATRS